MDIFFQDPDDPPLSPQQVHIRAFSAAPYADGRRVKVQIEISPFQKRPSGEVQILLSTGEQVASANVIETVTRKLEMTLHLRVAQTQGDYAAIFKLFYEHLPGDEDEGDRSDQIYEPPERLLVDQAEFKFSIP